METKGLCRLELPDRVVLLILDENDMTYYVHSPNAAIRNVYTEMAAFDLFRIECKIQLRLYFEKVARKPKAISPS